MTDRPKLTRKERDALTRLQRRGYRQVAPETLPGKAVQSLIDKGYVRVLPGLLDETPQGWAPAD